MKNMKPGHSKASSVDSGTMSRGITGQILSRYVKKNALFAMLFAVLGLWALQLIFAYLAELEEFSDTYTYVDALKYIAYRSPYFLEQFAPTGALLGAVIGLGLLANNSELIVMRAAGLSIYRIVGWVLQPAFIFVLIALAVNQFVLPQTNLKASQIRKPDTALLASVNGYWTLQEAPVIKSTESDPKGANSGSDNAVSKDNIDNEDKQSGYNIIYIDYADANGNIGEVKRWHLDADNNLTAVSNAKGGKFIPSDSSEPNTELDTKPSTEPSTKLSAEHTTETSASTAKAESELSRSTDSEDDLINYQWQLEDVTTLKLAERASIINSESEVEAGLNKKPLTGAEIVNDTLSDSTDSNQNTIENNANANNKTANNTTADKNTQNNNTENNNTENNITSVNSDQSLDIISNNEPLVTSMTEAEDTISLPISPSSVYLLTRRAEDLSLTQLYEHQRFNASQGTRSLEHEVAFWQKLLSPFAILSLVIVACSFVFGSLRTHSLGLRIVVALIFGLLFSYIQDLTSFVALATGASPLLMVLIPIIGSTILGLYLIRRQS